MTVIFIYKHKGSGSTENLQFDSDYCLHLAVANDDALLRKINEGANPLGSYVMLFKGMVVQDRESMLFDKKGPKSPDVFLLGKNITRWIVTSKKHTNYDDIVIIGGTKRREKHAHFPRILVRRTGDTLCCALLEEAALTESTLYSCWSITHNVADRYLLAILNSKLMNFYNKQMFITNQQGFPQVLMTDLKLLPIRQTKDQLPYIGLVGRILAAKKIDPAADTTAWEAEIDRLVYALYGLTEEEIAIVEGSGAAKDAPGKKRKAQHTADDEDAEENETVAKQPAAPSKKPTARKLKPNLPPSLPGWD